MAKFRTINKKQLTARVLCGLLLSTYLTGAYSLPVHAAASVNGNDKITVKSGIYASAWGYGSDDYYVTATGQAATAFGWGTKAEGNLATSFGQITAAYGGASTAFGWNSKAYGTASTAFGNSSETYGYGTTAFGSSSQAFGDYSTAFGEYTKAFGEDSTAFGYKTQAGRLLYGTTEALIRRYKDGDEYKYKIVDANTSETLKGGFATYEDAYGDSSLKRKGDYATAWGNNTKAIGEAAAAFGIGTTASGNHSTAFGFSTTASGEDSTSFGAGTTASGDDSTAFGYQSEASGDDSTAFGIKSIASGNGATAWGGYYNSPTDYQNGGTASGKGATAFGVGTTAKSEGSTAWGYYTTAGDGTADTEYSTAWGFRTNAIGYDATAWGDSTTASNEEATAWGVGTTASGRRSTAWGYETEAKGDYSTTWGSATAAEGKRSTAWGHETTAEGENATAWGVSTKATGKNSTAFGSVATASGHTATAWGFQTEASGKRATAWGSDSVASGETATAFGLESDAAGKNSLAALGGITEAAADNSAAIGYGAKVTVPDTVALGSDSVASREAGDANAYLKESNTGNAWISTHNAIAVGDDDTVTRQITGVAAGSKDTDAVNVAQLKELAAGTGAGLGALDGRINKVDRKLNKVGAGAAALAALHPIEADGKLSMGLSLGHYRNANAMALGFFYRPQDNVMVNIGGAMGNGENMINAGVTFALDKGVNTLNTSKAAMARKIASLTEENAQQAAKIETLEARLAALEAKLGK